MKTTNKKTIVVVSILVSAALLGFSLLAGAADTDEAGNPELEELKAGKNFIPTKVYSAEEDQKILKLFEGLRVADVIDGMDKAGLRNVGAMDPDIHPSWKDTVDYKHRFIGIALTVRYAPVNWPLPQKMNTEEFDKWQGKHYETTANEKFVDLIRPGTAVVIDDSLGYDVGPIGSFNILVYTSTKWQRKKSRFTSSNPAGESVPAETRPNPSICPSSAAAFWSCPAMLSSPMAMASLSYRASMPKRSLITPEKLSKWTSPAGSNYIKSSACHSTTQ
jgi:hypothetical protein